MYSRLILAISIFAGLCLPAMAQDPQAEEEPGRGVARISLLNGEVSVKRGDSGDLIAAGLNAPLVVDDTLLTGPASRAEIQFDYSNMVRLSADAELHLAELENRRYIVQVGRGTVTFRVLRDQESDVEVSTPNVSVRPIKRGIYRITVLDDGTSQITVRAGEADIYTPAGSERLGPGATMLARGTAAEPEYQKISEIRKDDWDRWNDHRDSDLERSQSYSYVSRDVYGAEDLDGQGSWVNSPEYGNVWSPRVASGWAPYQNGRWTWVDWYGWTWVSYDTWGWAPYHYGRWFWNTGHNSWCWYPGGRSNRHYWSPALVAFVGFGHGGANVGFGNVGWVPLGPREPFYRWWGNQYYSGYRNGGFGNNIRVANNINITNVYRNSRVVNGVTSIDRDGFGRGRSGSSLRVTDATFRDAGVMHGQLPIAPGRDSIRVADRDVRASHFQTRTNEQFFSRRSPAQVDRISFEQQRRGMEQATSRGGEGFRGSARAETTGRSLEGGTNSGWRRSGETNPVAPQSRGGDDGGWRRFGSARTGQASSGVERSGRFGEPGGMGSAESNRGGMRDSGQVGRQSDRGSWQRFGSNSAPSRSTVNESGVRGAEGFGGRGSVSEQQRSMDRGNRSEFRSEAPRSFSRQDSSPRMERGGDSVRISPPIIRDRSSSDSGFRGNGGGGMRNGGGNSGGGRSAPSGGPSGGGSHGNPGGGGGGGNRGNGGGGGRGR